MSLTKEERKQRARDRKQEVREQLQRFPGVRLHGSGVTLWIFRGDVDAMIVNVAGAPETLRIPLRTPQDLLAFIRALSARYNALAERMNATAAECALREVATTEKSA